MSRTSLFAGLLAVALGLAGCSSCEDPVKSINESKVGEAAKKALVPEEERLAYVKSHLKLHDLRIEPDTRPDDAAVVVPGVLRVHGVVENTGDKPVSSAKLIVHTQDETNGVIGTYVEEILGKKALEPGDRRPFKFKIPDKKEFAGRFLHDLR